MYYSATHSRPHRTVKQNRARNYNNFLERQNFYGYADSSFWFLWLTPFLSFWFLWLRRFWFLVSRFTFLWLTPFLASLFLSFWFLWLRRFYACGVSRFHGVES